MPFASINFGCQGLNIYTYILLRGVFFFFLENGYIHSLFETCHHMKCLFSNSFNRVFGVLVENAMNGILNLLWQSIRK